MTEEQTFQPTVRAAGDATAVPAARPRRPRLLELDLVRSFAIFAVVLIHSVELCLPLDEVHCAPLPVRLPIALLLVVGRTGVPLFLMLSGYLLLPRDYSAPGAVRAFWRRKLVPMLLAWEFWIVAYAVFDAVVGTRPFSVGSVLAQMLFFAKTPITNAWFMPVIIWLYVFVPLLGMLLPKLDGRTLAIVMGLVWVYAFFGNTLGVTARFGLPGSVYPTPCMGSPSIYGFYLVQGYCLQRLRARRASAAPSSPAAWAAILVVLLGLAVAFQLACDAAGEEHYIIWYDFALLPVLAVAIFCLCTTLVCKRRGLTVEGDDRLSRTLRSLSVSAFGVYLLHMMLMIPLNTALVSVGARSLVRAVVVLPAGLLVSWGLVVLLCRLGRLPRRLFLVRV